MAPEITHVLGKVVEQTNNLPPYRWYGTCSCGFATRQATQALVESQLDAHLTSHGVVPSALHSNAPVGNTGDATGKITGTWTPLGAKTSKPAETTTEQPKGPLGGLTPLGGGSKG